MRLREINQPSENYILDESIDEFYRAMINSAEYLKGRIEAGREKSAVKQQLIDFKEKYQPHLPLLRTLLAYDSFMRDDDDKELPTVIGVAALLKGDEASAKTELKKFNDEVIEKNQQLKATRDQFKKSIENEAQRPYQGYEHGGLVEYVLDMDSHLSEQMEEFYAIHEDHPMSHKDSITEIALELEECGLVFSSNVLNESKDQKEVDNYYMVVEMQLFDTNKSETIPHRNFKNVIATKAKSSGEARRKMKKTMERSLKALNDTLKKRNMKCACKHKRWQDASMMQKGYNTMKSKNIKSLSGSDVVSTGAYLLKGATGHGTVHNLPEYAPNRYAIHSSKASVSRYLNRECRDE